ncbi:CAF17-like 4Fe-4S cluster assembly/insertion protein YgfZ [Bremerella alba]|uniref:tRNA-modifying protein YgfZ n=1 Tax=Bremerella alba TaxID=980252 RepID=A0A7V8V6C6_9BACT|nr:hypothetical protein [Bremerella alba]MBA2115681.1 tRNA-modifying protein YgfZ [Bremerella alba]
MNDTISWVPSPLKCQIQISGPSHVRFLQGLCSNDVVQLEVGASCEAYIPSVQGKILAHGFLKKYDDRIVFLGLGQQREGLLPHWLKYAMIEDVEVADQSETKNAIFVWGENVSAWLREKLSVSDLPELLQHRPLDWGGASVDLFRTPLLQQESYEISGPDVQRLIEGTEPQPLEFEKRRIENRFPIHGVDIGAEHLAQEVNRDDQAISFKKGCYLGQETVARIDAMGHVNKKVVAVRWLSDQIPEELPAAIIVDGKEVGRLTSLADIDGQQLGLAIIRRGLNNPGARIESEIGSLEVVGYSS